MRRTLIWKGRFIPYMLLLVIFTGCAGSHSWQALPESSEDERKIFVVSHGWHTGLILPYESLSALPDLEKVLGESTYYEFSLFCRQRPWLCLRADERGVHQPRPPGQTV